MTPGKGGLLKRIIIFYLLLLRLPNRDNKAVLSKQAGIVQGVFDASSSSPRTEARRTVAPVPDPLLEHPCHSVSVSPYYLLISRSTLGIFRHDPG